MIGPFAKRLTMCFHFYLEMLASAHSSYFTAFIVKGIYRCASPAQDVDVAVATHRRDAKLHIELTRHIHDGGDGGQRHLQHKGSVKK